MMSEAGKRATRLASRATASVATQLRKQQNYYENKIKHLIEQINNNAIFPQWTKGDISERQKMLNDWAKHLENIHIDVMCDLDDATQSDFREDETLSSSTISAKAKLANRLDEFNAPTSNQVDNASIDLNDVSVGNDNALRIGKNKIEIEVQQTDSNGNIPNVWGKFDGDYAKWKSFHDRWVASMHDNKKVKTIVKFQNLQAACVGEAKGALGEWDLTEENYSKAWERLQKIYEDDYMQVQSFMQKLNDLPAMNGSTSKNIREIIDIVHKHIHGLQRYIDLNDKHPYVVFAVISKMDTDTYRAWEKYRPSLVKAQTANDDDVENDASRPGKHIPTWSELERFLEGEVTIRVHAERRPNHELSQPNIMQMSKKQQKRFGKQQNRESNADFSGTMKCVICGDAHMIYKCQTFIDLSIVGRLNQVTEHELCVSCLRKSHAGRCMNKRNNQACPKCLPDKKYHNSLLCPNANTSANAAMNASDNQRKRKSWKSSGQMAKKPRKNANSERSTQNRLASSVNKIGEWSLVAKQSNAIKSVKPMNDSKFEKTILLATIKLRMEVLMSNITVFCRAIADTGATLNCVTLKFVLENNLPTTKCQRRVLGVSGPEIIKQKIKAIARPWFDSEYAIVAEFFVLNQLDGIYPSRKINIDKQQIKHLGLADEDFDVPAPIDAIIGAEMYADIIQPALYKHKDGAIMQSTEFGHIILGKFIVKKHSSELTALNLMQKNDVSIMQNNKVENEKLQNALSKFWQIEDVNKCESKAILSEEQHIVEKLFKETYYREANGRYVVKIPIKPKCIGLGDSKAIAKRQFFQLERRFRKNPDLKQKYVEYMNENKRLGYMQLAGKPKADKLSYWLPHHAIMSKKFRVVLNGSALTSNGESLNSIQMTGPKLQYDSQLQTMRFRRHKYAVATDITKMFNRIGLNPDQWDLHRLFWRESEDKPLKEYVMTVVIFGEASSAYNAVRSMIQCANDHAENYPEASDTIIKSFYMDDGIFGCDNENELKILCKEVEFVLNQGHFMLKGWVSNSEKVESYLNSYDSNEIIIGEKDEEKILGLRWLKKSDELSISVNLDETKECNTKRSILSEIAKLYDPNGFIAPIVVKAKMLMQNIWRLTELSWDDKVPPQISKEWAEIYADLPLLKGFKVSRWLKTNKKCKAQIHAFCDASEKAYGTAIYVRVENESKEIFCSLLSAKSKVAPLKDMTIPRLELLAAFMLSEQLEAIVEACGFDYSNVTLWSDSMVALSWIKKHPTELKAFVSNRVQKIQEKTKQCIWKHVRSGDNPADLVSRGMRMQDFLKSKLWMEGPNWLKQAEGKWPMSMLTITPEETNEIAKECKPKAPAEKIFNIFSGTDNTVLYNKFQSWDKIVSVTAYVLRLVRKAKRSNDLANGKFITSEERINAIEFWIKYEQNIAFKNEIRCIKSGDMLPTKSSIASLRPLMDKNGILRVGGRIDKANIAYESKHQYIIPHKSRLSFLLLNYAHEMTMHGGAQLMIQFIRKRFWIPKIRFEARNFIKTCTRCVRLAQTTAKQIMAELPAIRLKPAPPFQHTGVDMAGPYHMRVSTKINANTRGRQLPEMKGWIAVFVCLVTRAVHLEAVEGMSADDFLIAYTKFVSKRGHPEIMYSDRGTNFICADAELKSALQSWQSDQVQRYVRLKGTEWKYITPSAPHEGGVWEAAVKQLKYHLKRVIGVQKYSFQGISALLSGVEACLNSRPLCKMSDDPDDREPLTPAHFLIGRSLKLPIGEKSDKPPYSIKRLYVQLQFQIQAFWKQFSNDYIQSLTQLPKWRTEQENLKIGQLVVIKADNVAPTYWPMGRIMQIYKGNDGKVRSVLLKTQTGQLERSIRKICVLPDDIELSYWK